MYVQVGVRQPSHDIDRVVEVVCKITTAELININAISTGNPTSAVNQGEGILLEIFLRLRWLQLEHLALQLRTLVQGEVSLFIAYHPGQWNYVVLLLRHGRPLEAHHVITLNTSESAAKTNTNMFYVM